MGLRCLLGHDFSEPRTEREREERGDEVIAAVRRVKECRRCGETRVVSENKEVTSVNRPAPEAGAEEAAAGSGSAGASARADEASGRAPDAGRSAQAGDAGDGPTTGEWPERGRDSESPISDAEEGFDHPEADPGSVDTDVEDDAEIIRSGPSDADTPTDAGERGRGEWPDADVNRSTGAVGRDTTDRGTWVSEAEAETETGNGTQFGSTADPASAGVDDGSDAADADPAVADDEDAEFIDADAAAGGDAGVDDGDDGAVPWPDHDGVGEGFGADESGDAESVEASGPLADAGSGPDSGSATREDDSGWAATAQSETDAGPGAGDPAGGATEGSAGGVELRTASDDPDAEYVCPECGEREPVGASSMRAGDICPDCKRGYIEERERE